MKQNLPDQTCETYYEICTELPEGNKGALLLNDHLSDSFFRDEQTDHFEQTLKIRFSHEIRTSMNAIMGLAQILCSRDISIEEKESYCNIICKETEQVLQIFNHIFDKLKMTSVR